MGYYIETDSNKNKASWIISNMRGKKVTKQEAEVKGFQNIDGELHIPVVVLDNGPFEAAGIAYSKREFDAFTRPSDFRPKTYLLVPLSDIQKQHPDLPI